VSLTAKIITTDTAEVVGAARAEFTVDETVQQLESKPNTAKEAPNVSEPQSPTTTPSRSAIWKPRSNQSDCFTATTITALRP